VAEVSAFLKDRVTKEYSDQRIAERLLPLWRDMLAEKPKSVHSSNSG
jgi:hypothetical protein